MVPTATTRLPEARASRIAPTVAAGISYHFGIHPVVAELLDLDGLECSPAHVQGDARDRGATRAHPIEDLLGEMQPRGRSRDRAPAGRVDGLVALAIGRARLPPLDVRRKGRPPDLLDLAPELLFPLQVELHRHPFGGALRDARAQRIGELEHVALPEPAKRPRERLPTERRGLMRQEDLDRIAHVSLRPREEARRKHRGVVDDEQVPRIEETGKVGERAMLDLPLPPGAHDHEARLAARERFLRDPLARQVVMEIGAAHRR